MSIFTRTAEEIKQGDQDKVKRQFLSKGKSFKVRIPNLESFTEYYNHCEYYLRKNFEIFSSVCTRHTGKEDAYDKAVKLMYDDLEKIEKEKGENSKEYKDLKAIINDLRAKPKMLFGFINLEDGQPLIIELSRNQGLSLVSMMQKNEKKIKKYAFEIYKSGEGTSTQVNLGLLDVEDELSDKELENWVKSKDVQIDFIPLFEKTLYVKTDEQRVIDLHKLGFDVTRIGYEVPQIEEQQQANEQESSEPIDPKKMDLPF